MAQYTSQFKIQIAKEVLKAKHMPKSQRNTALIVRS